MIPDLGEIHRSGKKGLANMANFHQSGKKGTYYLLVHTGLFCQISFGNSNFGKTYFFNIFLLETLQDIWYFDILRKKEFFYISNYHIY